jgi:trimeric autotransporter adhesin
VRRSTDDQFVNSARRILVGVLAAATVSALLILPFRETTGARAEPRVLPAASSRLSSSFAPLYADGAILALSSSGSTLYAAGSFTKLGRPAGHLSLVGRRSPRVLGGEVSALAADGHGGWFVGGDFQSVGGVRCPRLAHLRVDGSLDRRWCVAPDSQVWELTVAQSRLYVGGEFARIAGGPRSSAAAFELATAKLLPWHPQFRTSGCGGGEENAPGGAFIDKLRATRSTVFIGGCFDSVGGRYRDGLAAVDATSGKPKPWRPRFADTHGSWALAPAGDSLFVVGLWLKEPDEGSHPEVTRQRLAAVDARTGAVKKWYPTPNGGFSIEASGSTIYLGGEFSRIGGIRRRNLAAIDSATGAVSAWRPDPDAYVDLVVPARRWVYVVGDFERIGGARRDGLAAVDGRSGAAAPWRPTVRGVDALGVSGTERVALGLPESKVRGPARTGLAAIDTASGRITNWSPRISGFGGTVEGVAVAGGTVFIVGEFTRVGAHRRNGLAAINPRNGRILPWNPRIAGGGWDAIALSNGVVYVARAYDGAGNASRHLSAIDARNGRTLWDRSLEESFGSDWVERWRLVVVGSTVYLGDGADFYVVDTATGRIKDVLGETEWSPWYTAVAATDDVLYVAKYDSGPPGGVTAVDTSTGKKRWHLAGIDAAVTMLAIDHNVLYLGGYFDHIDGQRRRRFAAVDADTGELKRLRAEVEGEITAMHVVGPRLYISSRFLDRGEGHLVSVPLASPSG